MNCAWMDFMGILPPWIRAEINRNDKETLQELRLRIKAPPELVCSNGIRQMHTAVSKADLQFCLNAASKYSPWAAATAEKGYITAPGGHRIGICGQAVYSSGQRLHIQEVTSLCIRIARDFPGIAGKASTVSGSILILGAPGWGKTTLLRDLCRLLSRKETLGIVDERCELFPAGIPRGNRMDVLSGCPKYLGIEMLLRTMGPNYIAVDEITSSQDCEAIYHAANCGVSLLATAHGTSVDDFLERPVYRNLSGHTLFTTFLVLKKDKSYTVERIPA